MLVLKRVIEIFTFLMFRVAINYSYVLPYILTIGLLYDIFNFLGVFYVLISIANIVVKNISKTQTEKIVEC